MARTKTQNQNQNSTRTNRTKMKTCSISGRKFKATTDNFYVNHNSSDGLHPYHKTFDNIRRTNGVSTMQLRNIVKLINNA
jgi:hypothetical protein